MIAVHKNKETLTLDRPAYGGVCILDLSKGRRIQADFLSRLTALRIGAESSKINLGFDFRHIGKGACSRDFHDIS